MTLDQSQDADFGIKAILGCGVRHLPRSSPDNLADDYTHGTASGVKGKSTARLDLICALFSEEKTQFEQDLDAAFPCIPDLETFRSVLDNKT